MTSSDDEDLNLAISLSLQNDHETPEVIDLDSDENQSRVNKDRPPAETTNAPDNNAALAPQNGFLGIDRRKMEQERLARKRKRSPPSPSSRKIIKSCESESLIPPPDGLRSSERSTSQTSVNLTPIRDNAEHSQLRFRIPTVKKTWAFGHPRTGDDIRLEEVFQKNDLGMAVLSSFQWDIEWLLAKLDTAKTQITLVMQAKEQATKDQYRRETANMKNLRLCFPPMGGQVNCMHSKLMLLSYSKYLRVVVPTANLVRYDWGESGDMENGVFLIDLPRFPAGQDTRFKALTAFEEELIYFTKAMGLENSIVESLSNFDFATTKDIGFVHTIGGAHTSDAWRRTGYCGLGKVVRELGLGGEAAIQIDFVTSSIGSLNVDFLTMLCLAAKGDDGTTEYGWRNPEATRGRGKKGQSGSQQLASNIERIQDEIRDNFRIYFPTSQTVRASTAGHAGTICFQSKWYDSPTFPCQTLRDCKSTRTGLLMHNKIIYVRPRFDEFASRNPVGTAYRPWAYIGSANCSESAWGKLVKDRTTKAPKLNCRNWECGVVIPVSKEDGKAPRQSGLAAFESTIPVPMQYPGEEYGNRRPFFYAE